jgi:hypothetical protein
MVTRTESRQVARLRAAADRLHAAQLAALDTPAQGDAPAARRDAYGAEREVLAHLAEMGSLLVRLGASAQVDAQAADIRRRVVALAVSSANALAELVSLAFDLEGDGRGPAEVGKGSEGLGDEPEAALAAQSTVRGGEEGNGHGGNGASAPPKITSMRAVTDTNRLLVDQLRRLMQNARRRESWRAVRPGELWRCLLQQVGELLPVVAELETGAPSEEDAKELARLVADAANYLAFLRCYPRLPVV